MLFLNPANQETEANFEPDKDKQKVLTNTDEQRPKGFETEVQYMGDYLMDLGSKETTLYMKNCWTWNKEAGIWFVCHRALRSVEYSRSVHVCEMGNLR